MFGLQASIRGACAASTSGLCHITLSWDARRIIIRSLSSSSQVTLNVSLHLTDALDLFCACLQAEFDHVKKGLQADEEERAAEEVGACVWGGG